MAPLKRPQNFKFHHFVLQHESDGIVAKSISQTLNIVPTSFEPPFKVDLRISIEENKKKEYNINKVFQDV
jgi:hypothetical protein